MNNEEINTFDEIATMIKKENDYDVLANKCKQLEKENQELRKAVKSWNENGGKLIRENTKLKKALDILKEKFALELGISVVKERYCYSLEFLFNNSYFSITKEDYELLKSVLGEE